MLTPVPGPIAFNRRARDRISLDVQIILQFGPDASWVETDATLVDVSTHGMLIRCDRVPVLTQRVLLVIHHALLGECVALGSPVRFSGVGFGVRFEHVNDRMQELIDSLHDRTVTPRDLVIGAASELRVTINGGPH